MTKREKLYHRRKRANRFWGKIVELTDNYTLSKLKIQQFIRRRELPPAEILQIKETAIAELNNIINTK